MGHDAAGLLELFEQAGNQLFLMDHKLAIARFSRAVLFDAPLLQHRLKQLAQVPALLVVQRHVKLTHSFLPLLADATNLVSRPIAELFAAYYIYLDERKWRRQRSWPAVPVASSA